MIAWKREIRNSKKWVAGYGRSLRFFSGHQYMMTPVLLLVAICVVEGQDAQHSGALRLSSVNEKGLLPSTLIISALDFESHQPIPDLNECATAAVFPPGGDAIDLQFDGESGIAQLSGLASGEYTIELVIPGYVARNYPIVVEAESSTIQSVELEDIVVAEGIIGQVLNTLTGRRIRSVSVEIPELGLNNALCNVGKYQFDGVTAGSYIVSASADGYESQSLRTRELEGGVERVDFALTESSARPGTVFGAVTVRGSRLPGAIVRVGIGLCNTEVASLTDETGFYEISSLPPGTISVQVEYEQQGLYESRSIQLPADGNERLDFDLQAEGGPGCAGGTAASVPHTSYQDVALLVLTVITIGRSRRLIGFRTRRGHCRS